MNVYSGQFGKNLMNHFLNKFDQHGGLMVMFPAVSDNFIGKSQSFQISENILVSAMLLLQLGMMAKTKRIKPKL